MRVLMSATRTSSSAPRPARESHSTSPAAGHSTPYTNRAPTPLPRSQRQGYKVLFAAAVASLPPEYKALLRLEVPSLGPVQLPVAVPAKAVLAVVGWSLGSPGPSEASARARRARLGVEPIPSKRR